MSPRRWTGEILTKAGRRSTHPPHQCCSLSPLPWKSVCPLRPKLLEEERLIYSGRTPESGQDSLLGRTSLRPSLITPCPGHSSNNVCRGWAPTSVPDSFKLLSPSLGKRAHSIFTPVERRVGSHLSSDPGHLHPRSSPVLPGERGLWTPCLVQFSHSV